MEEIEERTEEENTDGPGPSVQDHVLHPLDTVGDHTSDQDFVMRDDMRLTGDVVSFLIVD